MAADTQQKRVYRQKLISYSFIFMLIWTMAFSAITIIAIITSIAENDFLGAAIIGCGAMSAVGWIIFGPILIHRKKIVIKNGVLSAHTILPKVYNHIVGQWRYNPRLSHLPDLDSKPLSMAISIGANITRGKIARFSWRVRWQRIDLSQIVEIRQPNVSVIVNRSASTSRAVDVDLDVIMLRNKSGMIHIIETTDFRDKDKEEILDLIEANLIEHLQKDVKPVHIPRPVVRLSKKQKKEAELAAELAAKEAGRKALESERNKQLHEQVRISKEAGKYSLILTQVSPRSDAVIAIIQEITGNSEHEAQEGIGNLPYLVIAGIERDEAMSLADRLIAADRCVRVAIK